MSYLIDKTSYNTTYATELCRYKKKELVALALKTWSRTLSRGEVTSNPQSRGEGKIYTSFPTKFHNFLLLQCKLGKIYISKKPRRVKFIIRLKVHTSPLTLSGPILSSLFFMKYVICSSLLIWLFEICVSTSLLLLVAGVFLSIYLFDFIEFIPIRIPHFDSINKDKARVGLL